MPSQYTNKGSEKSVKVQRVGQGSAVFICDSSSLFVRRNREGFFELHLLQDNKKKTPTLRTGQPEEILTARKFAYFRELIGEKALLNRIVLSIQRAFPEVTKTRRTSQLEKPTEEKQSPIPIELREIDASKIGLKNLWQLDVQLVGESCKKAIPSKIEVFCAACGHSVEVNLLDDLGLLLKFLFRDGVMYRLRDYLENCCLRKDVRLKMNDYVDLRIVYLKDLPTYNSKYERTLFETTRAYAVNHLIPPSKKVRVTGKIVQDPNTSDIVLVLDNTTPLEDEISNFKITEEDKLNFAKYYQQNPNLLADIDGYFIIPLVGQTLRKHLMYLVLHSPIWIRLTDGRIIRGLLRMIIVGDTKTYKSRSLEWINQTLQIGEKCEGESSSRAGLLYVIDPKPRALTWGVIPRNDLGLVLIAGLHTIPPEQMAEFREVLETLKLKVTRMVEGEAFCRTRIIADTNPKRESMEQYFYRCDALRDIYPFAQAPDLTRWDIIYTTKTGDVSREEIVQKSMDKPPTIPYAVQRRHILWAMSRRTEDIVLANGVEEQVNKTTQTIMNDYASPTLPIVHDGFKEVVWRLSVALAAALHSTDRNHQKIILNSDHVVMIENLLRYLYEDNLQLDRYVIDERSKTMLTDKDVEKVIVELDEIDILILKELRREPVQSLVLAERLRELGKELDSSTVRWHATRLKSLSLIDSSQGRRSGYELTPKGMQILARLLMTGFPKSTHTQELVTCEHSSTSSLTETTSCEQAPTGHKLQRIPPSSVMFSWAETEGLCEMCGNMEARWWASGDILAGRVLVCSRCKADFGGDGT